MKKNLNKPVKEVTERKIVAYSVENHLNNGECIINNCGDDSGVNNYCGQGTNKKCAVCPPAGPNSFCSPDSPGINNFCN